MWQRWTTQRLQSNLRQWSTLRRNPAECIDSVSVRSRPPAVNYCSATIHSAVQCVGCQSPHARPSHNWPDAIKAYYDGIKLVESGGRCVQVLRQLNVGDILPLWLTSAAVNAARTGTAAGQGCRLSRMDVVSPLVPESNQESRGVNDKSGMSQWQQQRPINGHTHHSACLMSFN